MISVKIQLPLKDKTIEKLRSGDYVKLNGLIYVAKDGAHKRMANALEKGEDLPFNLIGQTIFYVAPSKTRPGRVIGSASPTTSTRMDKYTPTLLARGLKGMIGKGIRSKEVKDAIKKYKAIYFGAIGGAGAFLSQYIKNTEVIAYNDLGSNSLQRYEVKDFPVVVINDMYGGDLYQEGEKKYKILI